MTDILLIRPPSALSKARIGSVSSAPPLGLGYLLGVLREEGYKVQAIDALGEAPTRIQELEDCDILGLTVEEVFERIEAIVARDGEIPLIGFSSMFSNEWFFLKKLITKVKKKYPATTTLLGGEHASALGEYSLNSCHELDYVIKGEGEVPVTKFANALLRKKGELLEVPGLLYREGDGLKFNPKAPRFKALDELPFPAWDLLPVENYLKEGICTITQRGQRVMPMLASRGCPYACKFCSNPQMYGHHYYIRDVEEVIREIKWLEKEYQITGFELHDLTFIVKRPWIKKFCRRLIEEKINLSWNVPTTRSEAIDEEVVELLKESGCVNLCLTPDSGSPDMIKAMKKNVDLDRITETARTILASKIILKVNVVFGFPGERHRDVWKSILYGMKIAWYGIGSVLFYRFVPYPGSEYFNELLKKGELPKMGPEFDKFLILNIYNELSKMKSYSEHISDRQIRFYIFAGYSLCQVVFFVRRPLEIFKTMGRVFKNKPQSNLDLLLVGLLRKLRMVQ